MHSLPKCIRRAIGRSENLNGGRGLGSQGFLKRKVLQFYSCQNMPLVPRALFCVDASSCHVWCIRWKVAKNVFVSVWKAYANYQFFGRLLELLRIHLCIKMAWLKHWVGGRESRSQVLWEYNLSFYGTKQGNNGGNFWPPWWTVAVLGAVLVH